MIGTPASEGNESVLELSMRALLEEEFKAVFGGTTPTTTAWGGLIFT